MAGLIQRNKKPAAANVAIARELAGWCWSVATTLPAPSLCPRILGTPEQVVPHRGAGLIAAVLAPLNEDE